MVETIRCLNQPDLYAAALYMYASLPIVFLLAGDPTDTGEPFLRLSGADLQCCLYGRERMLSQWISGHKQLFAPEVQLDTVTCTTPIICNTARMWMHPASMEHATAFLYGAYSLLDPAPWEIYSMRWRHMGCVRTVSRSTGSDVPPSDRSIVPP